ncbi:MAG TPA: isochorismatase family protein [Kofleriaceae bacterium]|nr:isochorismatase family protein [Kofleriaceae bacterium]
MPSLDELTVKPPRTALVIIDVQERLAAAMPEAVRAQVERNLAALIAAAGTFELPIFVSEQYPRGLGRTTPAVQAALDEVRDVCFFEKIDFAATSSPAWPVAVGDRLIDRWLVTGMETHICVFQTVRALREDSGTVHLVADACASRTKANFRTGLSLATCTGAVVTTTETVVFDLLGRAGTDDFRALSKLLK